MFVSTTIRSRSCQSTPIKLVVQCTRSRYFSRSFKRIQDEIHQIPVGGNGTINLKFIRPRQESIKQNYLVYLPAGPLPEKCSTLSPSLAASELAESLPTTTVIDVQYRLARRDFKTEIDHRFPTPIHDVFAALDYIKETVEEQASLNEARESKIAIYGSHIGGALALSLALTNPSEIHGVAVANPMVDWPILEEIAGLSLSKRKTKDDAPLSAAKALIALRSTLFRTPSGYFDSFASPVLFLRAPGRDTPVTNSAAPASGDQGFFQGSPIRYGDGDDEVGVVEYEDRAYGLYDDEWHAAETTKERNQYYRIDEADITTKDMQEGLSRQDSEGPAANSEEQAHPRRRKVLQRWPPNAYSEDALLPFVNIFSGGKSLTGDEALASGVDISPVAMMQAAEMTELLRRACFWGREKSFAEELVMLTQFDEDTDAVKRQAVVTKWLSALFT